MTASDPGGASGASEPGGASGASEPARGERPLSGLRSGGGEPLGEPGEATREDRGLASPDAPAGETEATGFLYPFIESEERDAGPLLVDLAASARAKAVLSKRLAASTIEATAGAMAAAGRAMAERFQAGGVLYTFGNGGSSSDAASAAALFSRPPSGRPLPARCLTEDPAILTALGNDVGFELVFARQLIAHARSGDMCIAMSTSGGSKNLLVAADQARKRGVLVVAMAGYDGGTLARSPSVDHSLVVHSDSVHRIQESQAALVMQLWRTVQLELTRKAA